MGRKWYEVRVRESITPNKDVKKSRFYEARSPNDAADHYKGKGLIMWVRSVKGERVGGTGSFFSLGDRLLKELRSGSSLLGQLEEKKEVKRLESKNKRFYSRERKKARESI